MTDIQSEADFIAAVEAMGSEDSTPETPATDQAQSAETPSAVETERATESSQDGLFYGVDRTTLTPEMQEMFDGMNKTFTQKNQELAPYKKLSEQYGDPDKIQESLQFVQALQDPKNLVQLHSELSEYLQSQGLTKAEADTAAASHITETDAESDDFGFSDPNEKVLQEINDLKSWKEQLEQEKLQAEIESDLARKESAIRHDNPSYTDDDVNDIYKLAYAFAGDLDKAHEAFKGQRQRILTAYANEKAAIPSGVASPDSTSGAEAPPTFESWEARHEYAKKQLAALENQGEF